MSGFVKVRFIRADGRRKVGMLGKMTTEKAKEMIDKKIVVEHNGPMTRQKIKFNLKNLIQWQ